MDSIIDDKYWRNLSPWKPYIMASHIPRQFFVVSLLHLALTTRDIIKEYHSKSLNENKENQTPEIKIEISSRLNL